MKMQRPLGIGGDDAFSERIRQAVQEPVVFLMTSPAGAGAAMHG